MRSLFAAISGLRAHQMMLDVTANNIANVNTAGYKASRVVFLTNVEGVLVDEVRVETLSPDQTEALITNGTIFGGMIPKVRTALHALDEGVPEAVITNLAGLQAGTGTVFRRG